MLNLSFAQFHFLQPLWLLAWIPLALIYWFLIHKKATASDWNKIVDAHLLSMLLKKNTSRLNKTFSVLLMVGWTITIVALANPVWEKKAVPVFQTNIARVIVLDLSRSMAIPDLKPSRLARAKFKIEDILDKNEEGQTGLVVFAGDAFTVTPLTRDTDTIRSMLSSLHPGIMPVQGSRADLGLLKAQELLIQAGVPKGQVLLIADGAEQNTAIKASENLRKKGYEVSVLAIGTPQGAAIPNVQGQDRKPIIVPLQTTVLKKIAQKGGGGYRVLQSSNADIDDLLASSSKMDASPSERADDVNHQDWKSEGPLFVLLLLPLAALAFRRGWLLSIGFIVITLGQPRPVMASMWDNLWKRQDQQADQALQSGQYQQAEQLAEDPLRRGSAAFKQGNYEQALSSFEAAEGADAVYNKGNALAQLKEYKQAIQAYEEALKQQPDMQDAIDNKAKIEELLKKQQQQQDQKNNKDNKKSEDQSKDSKPEKSENKDSRQGEQDSEKQPSEEQEGQKKEESEAKKDADEKDSFTKANEKMKKEQEQEQGNKESTDGQDQQSSEQQAEKPMKNEGENTENQKKKEDQSGNEDAKKAQVEADTLSKEEKIAAEQWLRRIPDNPGELLKRKFKYQYNRRKQPAGSGGVPW